MTRIDIKYSIIVNRKTTILNKLIEKVKMSVWINPEWIFTSIQNRAAFII